MPKKQTKQGVYYHKTMTQSSKQLGQGAEYDKITVKSSKCKGDRISCTCFDDDYHVYFKFLVGTTSDDLNIAAV